MSSYNENDYYPVLMRSIRGGVVVPFDCYLLIKNAQRIVHYINRNDEFPQDKLDKLSSFSVHQLHIKREDYDAYLEYLKSFFQTDEGKAALVELREEGKAGSIEGLPDDFQVDGERVVAAEPVQEEKTEVKDPGLDELVRILHSTADSMNDQFRLRWKLGEKEATSLMLATDRILLHLVHLKANAGSVAEEKWIVPETLAKIRRELVKIRGMAETVPEEQRKAIRGFTESVETDMELLANIKDDPEFATDPKTVVKGVAEAFRNDVWRLKHLLSATEGELLEDNLSDVVTQIEKTVGTKLDLKALLRRIAGKDPVDEATPTPTPTPTSPFSEPAGQPEEAKSIEAQSANTAEKTELAATAKPIDIGTSDATSLEELRSENNVLRLQLANAKSLVESGEKKIAELRGLKDSTDEYIASLEKEGSENKTRITSLLGQVATLEANVTRLEEGMNEHERVIQQQKADLEARDATLLEKEAEINGLWTDMRKLKRILGDFTVDPELAKQEIEKLPFGREFIAMLQDKQAQVTKNLTELERRNAELRDMKREGIKLRGHLEGVSTLKKQLAVKMERMTVERETVLKSQEALMRKITVLENLSNAERKAVSRLTAMIELLRQERLQHIDRTNAALKAHKEMTLKATSLSSHVENEISKNKALLEQVETSKQKQKDLTTEIGSLQSQLQALEVENKKLAKQVRTHAEGAGKTSEAFVAGLEKKIEGMRAENQELKAQYASEQQRAIALERELKALQHKTKLQTAA